MASGKLSINGQIMQTFEKIPNKFLNEKEIKKSLIDFGTMYDFDYHKDSVTMVYDLGEGFTVTLFKAKLLQH